VLNLGCLVFYAKKGFMGQMPDSIIYTAHSECISVDQVEISLDVEWAHAIAP
jgi:subtilase family serine protease